jgi:hypothetical protein
MEPSRFNPLLLKSADLRNVHSTISQDRSEDVNRDAEVLQVLSQKPNPFAASLAARHPSPQQPEFILGPPVPGLGPPVQGLGPPVPGPSKRGKKKPLRSVSTASASSNITGSGGSGVSDYSDETDSNATKSDSESELDSDSDRYESESRETRRRRRRHRHVRKSRARKKASENGIPSNEDILISDEQLESEFGPYYRVLHRIVCDRSFHRKQGKIFVKAPSWTEGKSKTSRTKSMHLGGSGSVENIVEFLRRSKTVAFLVVKDYKCVDSKRWRLSVHDPDDRVEESIHIVSSSLQAAIEKVARCSPKDKLPYVVINDGSSIPGECYISFFYHHRKALAALPPDEKEINQAQLQALIDYLETTHGEWFRQLDRLGAKGEWPVQNIPMLFCPNEVVITKTISSTSSSVILTGAVNLTWINEGRDISYNMARGWGLKVWKWSYNGKHLFRSHHTTRLSLPGRNRHSNNDIVKISELNIYPARFLSEDDLLYLTKRGKKFWDMRYQSFVSYGRPTFGPENYDVSV